ncbi:threonine/serine exporter family protein [Cellulomonas fimi]|uniref:threonine/serine ThrE exporter family protein n=1 Tax=Cellulomonas fimi TaxID=1708 RepID=UPI00234C909E|nr:threonine/serine exporter family protein [Cellulomonas fimi]MDC7123022.1 threonine/serine exporter family protein [Cellulomonas fimi]
MRDEAAGRPATSPTGTPAVSPPPTSAAGTPAVRGPATSPVGTPVVGAPTTSSTGTPVVRAPAAVAHRRTLAARLRRAAHALTEPVAPSAPPEPVEPPEVPPDLVPLLRELGAALLSSGQSVVDTERQIGEVAAAYGADHVRTIVLPTGVFVQVETARGTLSDFTGPGASGTLPLHQIGGVDRLVRDLVRGDADLAAARVRLREVLATPARFGPLLVVLGHALLTVGFGLILYPSAATLPVFFVLGAVVGVLRLLGGRWPTLGAALPVAASFLVTVVTITLVSPALGGDPVRILAPPLVSFLPGAVLTVAAIELTSNQVVAGASRFVFGGAQLLLLAFGVVAAVSVAGPFATETRLELLGAWTPWLGVLCVAVGHRFFSSPPRGTFWWLLLALYAAYTAQAVGGLVLDAQLSGFVGGLVVVPVSQAIQRARSGPPAVVTMLPAFWLLVPGALGFRGVSELATGYSFGISDLVDTVLALFSIALGVLVGTAATRDARRVTRTVVEAVAPVVHRDR